MRFDKLALAAVLSTALVASLVACGSDTTNDEDEGSSDSALTGSSSNDKTAFVFFVGKGLSKTQAAAIVGNLDQESSMNPAAKQAGGPGRGIAQWSLNDRWRTENTFASKEGKSATSLQAQLDFVWHELSTNSAFGLSALKRATALASAVQIVQSKYEICGSCNASSRLAFAKKALAAFGNSVSATVQDAPAADDDDDTTTPTATTAPSAAGDDDTTTSPTASDTSAASDSGSSSDDPVGDCIVDGAFGSCISTSACATSSGTSTPGLCPGAANIQCCTF